MKRSRKGDALIFLVVIIVIIVILSLLTKLAWFLTIAPVIRNILPFIIGTIVGYLFGRNAK
jgi:hypothetical protein